MTHEQKPESAEFRRREDQIETMTVHYMEAGFPINAARRLARDGVAEAEARGAAEQEAQGIEEAKDEGANYVLTSLALLFGRDGFEIRDGSETWEGDVNATLEGILKAGGLVDDEGDLLDLATLKDRLVEQRRKDAEGAEPVGYVLAGLKELFSNPADPLSAAMILASRDAPHIVPLYTRAANVAALEDRVKELEGTLRSVRAVIEQAAPKVLGCTLWMPGQPETVVDYISAAIREGGE